MNCKKTRRYLPLAAGSDLSPAKMSAVAAHLEKCSLCRKEYEWYLLSLRETKDWMTSDGQEWVQNEWQETVQKAVIEDKPSPAPMVPWPFKKSWAYALMVLFAAVLTIVLVGPHFQQKNFNSALREYTSGGIYASAGIEKEPQQDVVSMTFVSSKTGLKVVWFLNRNFDIEE
jgi:hypothetical protein